MISAPRLLLALTLAALAGCETAPTRPVTAASLTPPSDPIVLEPISAPIPAMAPGTFDIAKVDSPPRPILRQAPHYPTDLRQAGIAGHAKVLFTVTPQGDVTDLLVLEATDIRFADAAKRAIAQWRFLPALDHDQPVACRLMVPMDFQLSD